MDWSLLNLRSATTFCLHLFITWLPSDSHSMLASARINRLMYIYVRDQFTEEDPFLTDVSADPEFPQASYLRGLWQLLPGWQPGQNDRNIPLHGSRHSQYDSNTPVIHGKVGALAQSHCSQHCSFFSVVLSGTLLCDPRNYSPPPLTPPPTLSPFPPVPQSLPPSSSPVKKKI